jgi:hypothetical protein
MDPIDRENLRITGRHRAVTEPHVAVQDDVTVVVTQACGPKATMMEVPHGTRCELLCPVSGQQLDLVGEVEDGSGAKYYAIYLTPQLSQGSMVMISDLWGHYHSRIVDEFELISAWARAHPD